MFALGRARQDRTASEAQEGSQRATDHRVGHALRVLRARQPESSLEEIYTRFRSQTYSRINARRLEHLAALRLPVFDSTVLQVGAGIGDLVEFFVDRGCTVTATDGRPENVAALRELFPNVECYELDLDTPPPATRRFGVVHCYGTLYHVAHPKAAIEYMAASCAGILLLETCVSPGTQSIVRQVAERLEPDQALRGVGSRPTRSWVFNQLAEQFEFVYVPTVQPAHPEFPTDWSREARTPLTRAVFVASRNALDSNLLSRSLPVVQGRV